MIKKTVAIVVPIFRKPNSLEEISLLHLNKYLSKYDKIFVTPNSFKVSLIPDKNFKRIKFPDENFINVRKYSELLNTKDFYLKFKEYEYILIYQLDALVFSDKLSSFCKMGFDYIGSPWFNNRLGKYCNKPGSAGNIGNGGFSLRKVQSFIKVIDLAEKNAVRNKESFYESKIRFLLALIMGKSHQLWFKTFPKYYPFNEDGFWSLEAIKYFPNFKIAPFEKALKFGFEKEPRKCFSLNKNKLPFGTHAWARYDQDFWKPFLLTK